MFPEWMDCSYVKLPKIVRGNGSGYLCPTIDRRTKCYRMRHGIVIPANGRDSFSLRNIGLFVPKSWNTGSETIL
jgi:hypothetical protein